MKTVIVIPSYNEEHTIGHVISACRGEGFANILAVDDGSTDSTADMARAAGAVVVSHPVNRGAGAATQTGFAAALMMGADVVVTIDADGQHDPKDIERLLQQLRTRGTDIVIGSRFMRSGNRIPLMRRMFNITANCITFLLSGSYFSDTQSGLKAFSKKALACIHITSSGFEFSSEIIREARQFKLHIEEIPVGVIYSTYSLSKGQNLATGLSTVFKLVIRSLMR
jgi:glycosyltransferase involved in cell wall biosynthesis